MIIMRTETSKEGLKELVRWINLREPTRAMTMLEIGCFEGDSTRIFAEHFNRVMCIDPWVSGIGDVTDRVDMDLVFETFKKNLNQFDNIKILRHFSYEVYKKFKNGFFDMIYIDGSHMYQDVKRDLVHYVPKVRKDGYICGHDYRSKFPGVIKAVNEVIGRPAATFRDTSYIKIKRS